MSKAKNPNKTIYIKHNKLLLLILLRTTTITSTTTITIMLCNISRCQNDVDLKLFSKIHMSHQCWYWQSYHASEQFIMPINDFNQTWLSLVICFPGSRFLVLL